MRLKNFAPTCVLVGMSVAVSVGSGIYPITPAAALSAADLESVMAKIEGNTERQTLAPIDKGIEYCNEKDYKDAFESACADGRKAVDRALEAQKNSSTGGSVPATSLAIVSDLDETLLDNRPFFETIKNQNEDQIDWSAFENWQKTSQAKPLQPTLKLLSYARSRGVAIFFITGRMERLRRPTIENLVKHGIAYDGIYMRANGDGQSATTMKSAFRKQIEDMGFTIILNIGDQYSDLAGGHAADCEKLPNKIYFIR